MFSPLPTPPTISPLPQSPRLLLLPVALPTPVPPWWPVPARSAVNPVARVAVRRAAANHHRKRAQRRVTNKAIRSTNHNLSIYSSPSIDFTLLLCDANVVCLSRRLDMWTVNRQQQPSHHASPPILATPYSHPMTTCLPWVLTTWVLYLFFVCCFLMCIHLMFFDCLS